jgi:dihydrofolate reductase
MTGTTSAPIRLSMSMSLDGFIAGPDDGPGQELGRCGGGCWTGSTTGAVISGRRTFELAGRWDGDHHDGVPIHVLTHSVADGDVPPGRTTFSTDVVACAADARAAAGDRPVLGHGAGAAQALLATGQLDELEIHLVSVLLGAGRRLFASDAPASNCS